MINAAVNLRGLMTSLGAGGSLIAAALCAAVLVGGLLAVRGVVDGPAEANVGDVTVPGATASAAPARGGCPSDLPYVVGQVSNFFRNPLKNCAASAPSSARWSQDMHR